MKSHTSKTSFFRDRQDAGRRLAEALVRERPAGDIVVLALPRGGVPVAYEIAAALGVPLDILLVRKLGAPFNPELAVGAIASGGVVVYNQGLLAQLGLDEETLEPTRNQEERELERREIAYRGGREPAAVESRVAILVDDGVATGATMRAAIQAVRARRPRAVVVAVPSGSADAVAEIAESADKVVVLSTPEPYVAVGAWYEFFPQLRDEDVVALLSRASAAGGTSARPG